MSASRFWTATNPEIQITTGGGGSGGGGGRGRDKPKKDKGGGWSGRGRSGWGRGKGAASVFPPITELIVIPSDHGSRTFEILTIDNISLSNFSFIQMTLRNISHTGGSGSPNLSMRLSDDGGSTWINGASDYLNTIYDATSSAGAFADWCHIADINSEEDAAVFLSSFNAEMPTAIVTHEQGVTAVTPGRRGTMTVNSPVSHSGIQLYVFSGAGSPVFNGGNIDIVGYR